MSYSHLLRCRISQKFNEKIESATENWLKIEKLQKQVEKMTTTKHLMGFDKAMAMKSKGNLTNHCFKPPIISVKKVLTLII